MSAHSVSYIKRCFVVLATLSVVLLRVSAQEQRLQNRPYIDLRKFHYGFMVGLHQQHLNLKNNGFVDPETGEQWLADNNRLDPSFTVGVLGEWRMTSHLAFRLQPTMHFGSRHLSFRNQANGERRFQELKSTHISLPANIKFSAPRFNNYRPYFIGGVNIMYDLTAKNDDEIRLKPVGTYLEIGFGCDYYLPFFKLIPELRFCIGLNNLLETNRSDLLDKTKEVFTKSLDGAYSNMVVLTLYFE